MWNVDFSHGTKSKKNMSKKDICQPQLTLHVIILNKFEVYKIYFYVR